MTLREIQKLVDAIHVQSKGGGIDSTENYYQARAMLKIKAEQIQSAEIQKMVEEIDANACVGNLRRIKGLVEAMIASGYE